MQTTIKAPRGADYQARLSFPDTVSLTGYAASFTIYNGIGGAVLVSVTDTPTTRGSVLSLTPSAVGILITAADLASLPVNSDPTQPRALAYDAVVSIDGASAILAAGQFQIQPLGFAGATDYEDRSVDPSALAGIAA